MLDNHVSLTRTTITPQKKDKVALVVLIILLILIIGATFGGYYYLKTTAPKPYVYSAQLSADVIQHDKEIYFEVEYYNPSNWDAITSFPIYLQDELFYEENVDLVTKERFKEEYVFSNLDAGDYTIELADEKYTFTVLSPAQFELKVDEFPDLLIDSAKIELDYKITNVGESKGDYDVDVKYNGEVIKSETYSLRSQEDIKDSFNIDIEGQEDISISVNDYELKSKIYTPVRLDNGEKLMENTVRGYGYFEIFNTSKDDMIIYVTKVKDPSTAVAAIYIRSDDDLKFRSFPNGSYNIYIQKGSKWIPDVNAFANNNEMYKWDYEFDFNNNVDEVYGGNYTSWTITLNNLRNNDDFIEVEELPIMKK